MPPLGLMVFDLTLDMKKADQEGQEGHEAARWPVRCHQTIILPLPSPVFTALSKEMHMSMKICQSLCILIMAKNQLSFVPGLCWGNSYWTIFVV